MKMHLFFFFIKYDNMLSNVAYSIKELLYAWFAKGGTVKKQKHSGPICFK